MDNNRPSVKEIHQLDSRDTLWYFRLSVALFGTDHNLKLKLIRNIDIDIDADIDDTFTLFMENGPGKLFAVR